MTAAPPTGRKPARRMVATRISSDGIAAIEAEAESESARQGRTVSFSEMHRTLLGEALAARAARRRR